MHDGADENGKKGWFERQQEIIERLAGLSERLSGAKNSELGDVLDELSALTSENEEPTRPTPEEREEFRRTWKERGSKEFGARLSESLARVKSLGEAMNRPSPTDLGLAISHGDLQEVRRLLDAGVEPNSHSASERSQLATALLFGHDEIATLLRECGAAYGLMEASLAGDDEEIVRLLDAGADVNRADLAGDRPLYLAIAKGHTETVRLLLARGADPNRESKHGHTPVGMACASDFPEIADLLVSAGARVGLIEAAYRGDLPLLRRLLDEGADVETEDRARMTPLRAAALCGHVEVVRFLLEYGAAPDREDENGTTPLGLAVGQERVPVIHLLIDRGADVNRVSGRFASTPLSGAVLVARSRSVEALLSRGADPNQSGRGWSPLHLCARSTGLLSKPGTQARIAGMLLDAGADIEAQDGVGHTPLMAAAQCGNAEVVRVLLERGADVRTSAPGGHASVLSSARRNDDMPGRREGKVEARTLVMEALGPEHAVFDAAERGDVARLTALLDAGAPADQGLLFDRTFVDGKFFRAEDFEGTPLIAAAGMGHVAAVRLLLEHGGIREHSMDRALVEAEEKGQEETANLLRAAGASAERVQMRWRLP